MSRDTHPLYSKSRVNKAGNSVRSSTCSAEDMLIIENWRASHTHILNTFQANLRRRTKDKGITVAQRLKRRITIFDKLKRENGMALARMHDIAGCRLIFNDISELNDFRKNFHKGKFDHRRKNLTPSAYDYIECPKHTGYRGIHDVYEYVGTRGGKKWDGLCIEIQYRTIYQHAWSTAVEIAGSITESQPKFNRGDNRYKEFFKYASEIIARAYEGCKSCYPDVSNRDLVKAFYSLEREIHLLRRLKGLHIATASLKNAKNVVLIFCEKNMSLEAFPFGSSTAAVNYYFDREKKAEPHEDIVLVRGDTNESIRHAFRNYFADAQDFVQYITQGALKLKNHDI